MPHRVRLKPSRYSIAGRGDVQYRLHVLTRRLNRRLQELVRHGGIDAAALQSIRQRVDRVTRIRQAMKLSD